MLHLRLLRRSSRQRAFMCRHVSLWPKARHASSCHGGAWRAEVNKEWIGGIWALASVVASSAVIMHWFRPLGSQIGCEPIPCWRNVRPGILFRDFEMSFWDDRVSNQELAFVRPVHSASGGHNTLRSPASHSKKWSRCQSRAGSRKQLVFTAIVAQETGATRKSPTELGKTTNLDTDSHDSYLLEGEGSQPSSSHVMSISFSTKHGHQQTGLVLLSLHVCNSFPVPLTQAFVCAINLLALSVV